MDIKDKKSEVRIIGGKPTRVKVMDPDDTVHLKGGEKFHVVEKPKQPEEVLRDLAERIRADSDLVTGDRAYMLEGIEKALAAKDRMTINRVIKTLEAFYEAKERKRTAEQKRSVIEDECYESLQLWIEGLYRTDSYTLVKNTCSRLHKLKDTYKVGDVDGNDPDFDECQSIVVQHDWLRVVGIDNLPTNEDLILPFTLCAFEFYIGGRSVIVMASNVVEELKVSICLECEHDVWIVAEDKDNAGDEAVQALKAFLWGQVKAICTILEAQVAEFSTVPAPDKLNAKRLKSGKTPLNAYHVVDLSKKHRHRGASEASEYQGIVKLHWRIGHWRNFKDGKRIRIKPMLVGNPDLGFVDKHYRI